MGEFTSYSDPDGEGKGTKIKDRGRCKYKIRKKIKHIKRIIRGDSF